MEKHPEIEKDTQPISFALAKQTRKGKQCAALRCSNTFYDSDGTATGIHFLSFPRSPKGLIASVT